MKKLTKEQRKEIAWEEYEKIKNPAYEKYKKIQNTVHKEYQKKIKEINDETEEIPEIIEQNGRKYRLVEE